ncbi:hypothetical protein MCERE19_01734 [Spirosomataceae bacterium]
MIFKLNANCSIYFFCSPLKNFASKGFVVAQNVAGEIYRRTASVSLPETSVTNLLSIIFQ